MESSLVKSFTNANFDTRLTVIMISDQIWFIAKEVAEALEYSSVQKALQGVKDKYKKIFTYDELQAICQSNQFGYFEIPTRALTRYLKKRNVPHRRSDHPDNTGYLFTIFNVEEAMNVMP